MNIRFWAPALGLIGSTLLMGSAPVERTDFKIALTTYVDALPIPTRIKVSKNTHDITITMNQFAFQAQSTLSQTQEWGYNGISPGPTIEVEKGQLVRVHWKNELPTTHVLMSPSDAM